MKVLLLAALVSQVVGRPQQADYQPGNAWSNTRPAQPTQWSSWSSAGGGGSSSYNSYDSYNSYNPYNSYNSYNSYVPGGNKQPYLRSNSYDSYVPGGNKQPYLRSGDNSVSGFVGGPAMQDIGLGHQGSLPNVETTRGDIGEPQITNNVDEYQGWNTLPARPSYDPQPSFPGFPQPATPCSGGARPSPCSTGRCPSPWGGACATACNSPQASSPCSQSGPGPMPQPLPVPMPAPMPQPVPGEPKPMPWPMPVPRPQPMQPGNCGSGSCGQMPPPSRCQLASGPQMGPLLGPIATTGCGGSDRDMPTYGAPSNGWMPGNRWMTKPWPQQPMPMPLPMPMPMPEPMPSGNCGPGGCGQESEACNSCG